MDLKVKNLENGEIHRLKSITKTYCGIDISIDESKWCIVGKSEKVNCRSNKCEKPQMQGLNRMILKLRHCI